MNANHAPLFQALMNALNARGDDDTRDAARIVTPHIIGFMYGFEIDPKHVIGRISAPKGDAMFTAQKSIKRALRLVQGVGTSVLSTVPPELICEVICNRHFRGERVSNELARAFLSTTMTLDDVTVEKLARKNVKISERMRKSVSTASAQASSIKGAIRMLGIGDGQRHSRDYGAFDWESPLLSELVALIKSATN